jgi:hypothetical protein
MKISKIVTCAMLVIVSLALFSSMGIMAAPPAVPTPKPVSSGGGGGSGGSYIPPTFAPYTLDLKSSDGGVIGTVVGKDFYRALLTAEKDAMIDNRSYSVTMEAELGGKPPDDARLDLTFYAPDDPGLPKGMSDVKSLGLLSIKKGGTSWGPKAETVKLTIDVPGVPATDAGVVYYLVHFDGSVYRIQNATLQKSEAGRMTFVVSPGTDSGLFTLVEAGGVIVTATPTPTPVANLTVAVEDTKTQKSLTIPEVSVYQFFAILGAAAVICAMALFFVYRYSKR